MSPRLFVLAAIRFYQHRLSPLKGFRCAYRCHTGAASCSALGYRAVRRYGVRRGLGVTRLRLQCCGASHRARGLQPGPLRQQRGACDIDCGGVDCDLPSGRSLGRVCDVLGCLGDCGSCDWPRRDRKTPRQAARARAVGRGVDAEVDR